MTPGDRGAVALILVAASAAYANAVTAGFQFDDFNVIVDNPAVHGIAAWFDSMPGIRALLKLSYTMNWVSGLGAPGFHAINIMLHTLNTLLVFALIRTVLASRVSVDNTIDATRHVLVAGSVALLFALHPAQTEAVSYISGRSVSMMASFYLGAALIWLRAPESGRAQAVSAALFACALATRETAWTLPLALLLLAHAGGRRWRASLGAIRAHATVLVLFVAAVLAVPGYRRLLIDSISVRTLDDNLLTQIDGLWYLLTQPLLHLQLNIDPDLTAHASLNTVLAVKATVLLALVAAGLVLLKRRPLTGCALLWTFLHLLPTNSILPRLDVANDRHLYLAMIGPTWIVATLFWGTLRIQYATAATAMLALLLASQTALRNRDYRDEISLWRETAVMSPDKPRVWNNLGYAYRLNGDTAAARAAFEKALSLDPSFDKARHNLDALDP